MRGARMQDQPVIATVFGAVALHCSDDAIVAVDLRPQREEREASTELGREAVTQVRRYLADPAAGFDLPLRPLGTPFQLRVWNALRRIPSGEVRSYGQLATELGTSPRAIGGACRHNPLPLLVPCHRIVAREGLGGYSGQRGGPELMIKTWLLTHERVLPEPLLAAPWNEEGALSR